MVRSQRLSDALSRSIAVKSNSFLGTSDGSCRNRIDTISERPESFGRIHDQLRAAMVDRFPYVILFECEKETVSLFGIFHAASDRGAWFERSV
jgi:hypothetical protein